MNARAQRIRRFIPRLAALVAAGAVITGGFGGYLSSARAQSPDAAPADLSASAYVGAFRGYGLISSDMSAATDIGFNWIKLGVEWKTVQPNHGSEFVAPTDLDAEVARARSLGLNILLNVSGAPAWATGGNTNTGAPPTDPATIQAFMNSLAARYQGRVQAYEYGNEPNTHDFWGKLNPDPVKFAQVMSGFYKGTKAGDPNAYVITGGLSNTGDGNGDGCTGACSTVKGDLQFVMELYSQPAAQYSYSCTDASGQQTTCWDGIGHHPYGGPHAPETDPYVPRDPPETGLYFQRLYQVWQMQNVFSQKLIQAGLVARRAPDNKSIWATEFGWLTDRGLGCDFGSARNAQKVTSQQQADYFVRAFNMMHQARAISNGDTMDYPNIMGPLFVFHDLNRGNPSACPPAGEFDDAFYRITDETRQALKNMPKTGVTITPTATATATPTQTPTATRTPTVTPTYSPTPFGTPALRVYLPMIARANAAGW